MMIGYTSLPWGELYISFGGLSWVWNCIGPDYISVRVRLLSEGSLLLDKEGRDESLNTEEY
jgi:hypothetical protein